MKAYGTNDKITFVANEGERSWGVINAEYHVGRHIELSAHVYKDKARSM